MPTSAWPCRIWRCRFISSTTSSSTTVMSRTPAAARAKAAGQPRPPAPIRRTLCAERTVDGPSLKVRVRREVALARVAQDSDDRLARAQLARDVEGHLHRCARRDADQQALSARELQLRALRVRLGDGADVGDDGPIEDLRHESRPDAVDAVFARLAA